MFPNAKWMAVVMVAAASLAAGGMLIDYDFDTAHVDATTVYDQATADGFSNDGARSASGADPNVRFIRGDHAFVFDGSTGSVATPTYDAGSNLVVDIDDQLSISAWVRPSKLSGYQRLVTRDKSTARGDGDFIFDIEGIQQRLRFIVNTGTGYKGYQTTLPPFAVGEWAHVTGVFDGSGATAADRMQLYINGQPVAVTTFGGGPPTGDLADTDRDIVLATDMNNTSRFKGVLDDVRVSNHAVTAVDVQAEYWRAGGIGVNLVDDPGFESGALAASPTDGWHDWRGTPEFSTEQPHSGDYSLKLGTPSAEDAYQAFNRAHLLSDGAPLAVDWYVYPTTTSRTLKTTLFQSVSDSSPTSRVEGPLVAWGAAPAGQVSYYDGSWHTMGMPFAANAWYHARMVLNLESQTYDFFMSQANEDDFFYVATDLAFRSSSIEALRWIEFDYQGNSSGSPVYIDDVRIFVVPEPATLTLVACGAAVAAWRRRRA